MRCKDCKFFFHPINDGQPGWEVFGNCTISLPRWVPLENGSKIVTFNDTCDLGIKNEQPSETTDEDPYESVRQ